VTVDPLWINASAGAPAYTANELRAGLAALGLFAGRPVGARAGVRPGGTSLNVQLSGTTITVKAGTCIVDPGLTSVQGPYLVAFPSDVTLTLTAQDATNPRKDLVYVRVYDNDEDGSGSRFAQAEYLAGTPAPSPALPALPASSLRLASIDVPKVGAGSPAVTIDGAFTAATGGIVPVRSTTDRATLSTFGGLTVFDLATKLLQVYDGAAWQYLVSAPQKTTTGASRVHWGEATGTTDGTGVLTVTHGAGFTPVSGLVSPRAPSSGSSNIPVGHVGPYGISATTFLVRVWNQTNAAIVSDSVTVAYLLWA
jgi:hypothetical protein